MASTCTAFRAHTDTCELSIAIAAPTGDPTWAPGGTNVSVGAKPPPAVSVPTPSATNTCGLPISPPAVIDTPPPAPYNVVVLFCVLSAATRLSAAAAERLVT